MAAHRRHRWGAMTTRTSTSLTDDIDGGRADHTVSFALDGETYELDLSARNRAALHRSLAPFIAASRRLRNGIPEPTPFRALTRVDPRTVREWARARGIPLTPRGRIPQEVVDQFRAAGN